MLTRKRASEISIKIIKELGGKKDMQLWCKENNFTMEELEEYFNSAVRYAALNHRKHRRLLRRRA